MSKRVPEIPALDPLVEGGILDVPARSYDLQGGAAGHLTCQSSDDGKTPSARCLLEFGDNSPDHPKLSFIGIEGLNLIHIPELNMLFALGIIVDLTGLLALP